MIITWTHSWETPNFSGDVPFCYSSSRRRDFMERVSGPLCGDNDQSFRRGVTSPSSPGFQLWACVFRTLAERAPLPGEVDHSFMTTCFSRL